MGESRKTAPQAHSSSDRQLTFLVLGHRCPNNLFDIYMLLGHLVEKYGEVSSPEYSVPLNNHKEVRNG